MSHALTDCEEKSCRRHSGSTTYVIGWSKRVRLTYWDNVHQLASIVEISLRDWLYKHRRKHCVVSTRDTWASVRAMWLSLIDHALAGAGCLTSMKLFSCSLSRSSCRTMVIVGVRQSAEWPSDPPDVTLGTTPTDCSAIKQQSIQPPCELSAACSSFRFQ